ncbi:helix-turn-helix domain-containing protein [Candidatus Bipolaricaulota bacterium]|nr:helix-turn-helix domain-containing protein [Candidatus Bipolaricaulota bacterium]
MVTLDEIAKQLGLSKRAVRQRIDALSGILDPHISRGAKNKLIFSEEALGVLRRLEELHHTERIPIRQAAARVRGELEDRRVTETQTKETDFTLEIKLEYLQQIVEVLRQDRDYWRDVALTVQAALPPDRMWISKLFPAAPRDNRLN